MLEPNNIHMCADLLGAFTHWRMTVSNQEELHSGTLRQARALALIMKSFTLSLIFWALTSCGEEERLFGKRHMKSQRHVLKSATGLLMSKNSQHWVLSEARSLGPCWHLQTDNSGGWFAWTASTAARSPAGETHTNAPQLWSIIHHGQGWSVLAESVLINAQVPVSRAKCGSRG